MTTDGESPFYSFGYGPAAVANLKSRTARAHASFFLPELNQEMRVLDLGCGPGSITVGLAEAVPNGSAVGIDIEPGQIRIAENEASQRGLTNCTFDVGSVESLPYESDSFDAVFGHTILMQFRDPSRVLEEVKRVLCPGGVVGFRETDFGAALAFPADSAHARVMMTLRESILRNGGFPDIGRQLRSIVHDAGFDVQVSSASYNVSSTAEKRAAQLRWLKNTWADSEFVSRAVSEGWLTQSKRIEVAKGLEREESSESLFFAMTFCECVATVPHRNDA